MELGKFTEVPRRLILLKGIKTNKKKPYQCGSCNGKALFLMEFTVGQRKPKCEEKGEEGRQGNGIKYILKTTSVRKKEKKKERKRKKERKNIRRSISK